MPLAVPAAPDSVSFRPLRTWEVGGPSVPRFGDRESTRKAWGYFPEQVAGRWVSGAETEGAGHGPHHLGKGREPCVLRPCCLLGPLSFPPFPGLGVDRTGPFPGPRRGVQTHGPMITPQHWGETSAEAPPGPGGGRRWHCGPGTAQPDRGGAGPWDWAPRPGAACSQVLRKCDWK